MATLGLFYGVNHWNAYFPGIMYLRDKSLYPLQVVLRNMIQTPNISQELAVNNPLLVQTLPPETIKMAAVVVAIVPVMVIYPFLQRYFIRGMLLGSIKG
jgi:putative aldouronate transport system permease protein